MKNRVIVQGQYLIIVLDRRKGDNLQMIIDSADLERLSGLDKKIVAKWNEKTQSFYAIFNENGTTVQVHRYLMNAEKGQMVDHYNHDTLDNRKENLKIVNNQQNQQNRKGLSKNNKSGVRGVCWYSKQKKWCARIRLEGKECYSEYFDDLEEAKTAIESARKLFMPYLDGR